MRGSVASANSIKLYPTQPISQPLDKDLLILLIARTGKAVLQLDKIGNLFILSAIAHKASREMLILPSRLRHTS